MLPVEILIINRLTKIRTLKFTSTKYLFSHDVINNNRSWFKNDLKIANPSIISTGDIVICFHPPSSGNSPFYLGIIIDYIDEILYTDNFYNIFDIDIPIEHGSWSSGVSYHDFTRLEFLSEFYNNDIYKFPFTIQNSSGTSSIDLGEVDNSGDSWFDLYNAKKQLVYGAKTFGEYLQPIVTTAPVIGNVASFSLTLKWGFGISGVYGYYNILKDCYDWVRNWDISDIDANKTTRLNAVFFYPQSYGEIVSYKIFLKKDGSYDYSRYLVGPIDVNTNPSSDVVRYPLTLKHIIEEFDHDAEDFDYYVPQALETAKAYIEADNSTEDGIEISCDVHDFSNINPFELRLGMIFKIINNNRVYLLTLSSIEVDSEKSYYTLKFGTKRSTVVSLVS